MPFVQATLTEKKCVAVETYECTFSLSAGALNFSPGQYIWVILPELEFPDEKGSRRAFSISSSALNQNSISILFRNSESGYKKSLLNLQEGSGIHLSGPYGSAFTVDGEAEEIILVAGGVGIAPFLGLLRSYKVFSPPPQLALFYSNSSKEKECFGEELEELCSAAHAPFLHPTSRFDSSLFSAQQLQQATWFICGPAGMVDDVASKLRIAGVSPARMRFEQMYPKNFVYD